MADTAYFYAIGRRKTARATVKLYPQGSGEFTINGQKLREWADNDTMILQAMKPLEVTGAKKNVNVVIRTSGGGKQAQADSVLLGIARALVKHTPAYRETLKEEGLMTRDSRVKERKKPGLKRARRASQFSKR